MRAGGKLPALLEAISLSLFNKSIAQVHLASLSHIGKTRGNWFMMHQEGMQSDKRGPSLRVRIERKSKVGDFENKD